MFDFSAIDQTFLTRFCFALCFYWVWGIASKGFFEPIQAQIGKSLASKFNSKTKELQNHADQTCSEIDNFFVNHIADGAGRIDRLVNGADIPTTDQRAFRQLLSERYQLSLLLEKLGVKDAR